MLQDEVHYPISIRPKRDESVIILPHGPSRRTSVTQEFRDTMVVSPGSTASPIVWVLFDVQNAVMDSTQHQYNKRGRRERCGGRRVPIFKGGLWVKRPEGLKKNGNEGAGIAHTNTAIMTADCSGQSLMSPPPPPLDVEGH